MLVKSSIDVCICGINVEIDGASPLINDIHGLNVTTISPNSDTVPNLILICSIANFASAILFFAFLTSCNSIAYVLAFDSFRASFENNFFKNVKEKGAYFDQGLNKIKNKYPKIIGEIRGLGLMKGLRMLVDNVEFMKKLEENKMLTVKAEENVIRLFPPLIITNEELDEAINKIGKACKEMS